MNWSRTSRIEAPLSPILSLSEVKLHLNVTHADEDAYIGLLIDAATASIDGPNGIGMAMVHQTYRLTLDCLPAVVQLPIYPVHSIDTVRINEEVLDPASLFLVPGNPATLFVAAPVHVVKPASVQIDYVAGFGTTGADVPADLRAAALLIIGHLYANREAVSALSLRETPLGVQSILARYRAG